MFDNKTTSVYVYLFVNSIDYFKRNFKKWYSIWKNTLHFQKKIATGWIFYEKVKPLLRIHESQPILGVNDFFSLEIHFKLIRN